MPIVSDPKARYPYVLESDRAKDPASCPIFFFQIWTVREYRAQMKTIADLTGGKGNDEVFDAAVTLIGSALLDWNNVRNRSGALVPFDATAKDQIVDIVGINELMEIAYAVVNQEPDPETKKKLYSQLASAPDSAEKKTAEVQSGAPDQSTQ